MENILLYDVKPHMLNRLKNATLSPNIKIIEADSKEKFMDYLSSDIFDVSTIIGDINFEDLELTELVSNYITEHSTVSFIVFSNELTRNSFLKGVKIGISEYILKSSTIDELRVRIKNIIVKNKTTIIPTNVVLDLRKYISGELKKADKGNYTVTVAFSSLYDSNDNYIKIENTSIIAKYFSNSYWDTDSILIYGNNHLFSIFPFCDRESIDLLDEKLQHLLAEVKSKNLSFADFKIVSTYAAFPEEGLTIEDILKIIERKIDLTVGSVCK